MRSSIGNALVDLVKIYSPTGEEEPATAWFRNHITELGLTDVGSDAAGNAFGKLKGTGLKVTLCGHIDTVPGELPVSLNNGELTGRGSVDAKSSLISLLYGGIKAKEMGFQGTLNIIAAIGEEGPGKGIIEVASSHEKTDYAILGEPSYTTSITVGYRGRLLLNADYQSDTHHASAPWMGKSALESAIQSWERINKKYGSSKDFSKVSVALTSLHGGEADNVTPSNSSMTLDVRFPPSVNRKELFEELKSMFELESGMPGSGKLQLNSYVEPYVSNVKTPLVKAFKNSIKQNTGETAKLLFKSGSGDMNHLATSWKIPCITYGPGNTQLSHTNDEKISIAEVEKSAEVVAYALLELEKDWISSSDSE